MSQGRIITADLPRIGRTTVEMTPKGISKISFGKVGGTRTNRSLCPHDSLIKKLEAYANGERIDFGEEALDISGTDFQMKVWKAMATIPFGETRSYTWLAREVGSPRGFRAAANACGANPVPIIIPCHRVVASDGSIGGFSCGIELKKILLSLEGISDSK